MTTTQTVLQGKDSPSQSCRLDPLEAPQRRAHIDRQHFRRLRRGAKLETVLAHPLGESNVRAIGRQPQWLWPPDGAPVPLR